MNFAPIRVLIVDDHEVVRKGTRAFLDQVEGVNVAGQAGSGKEAVRLAESLDPDVILMDLMMPEMDGIEATAQITSENQRVRILVLTSFIADEKLFSALQAGAHNYLMKDSTPDELVEKIHQTHRGESELHYKIARNLLSSLNSTSPNPLLTSEETNILKVLSTGATTTEAAQKLQLAEEELRRRNFRILEKLHQSLQA